MSERRQTALRRSISARFVDAPLARNAWRSCCCARYCATERSDTPDDQMGSAAKPGSWKGEFERDEIERTIRRQVELRRAYRAKRLGKSDSDAVLTELLPYPH